MIERLEATKFRGLLDLTLSGFSRVNLFVGANSLGKTSVIEAIACTCNGSSPAFYQYLSQLRGFPPATLQNDLALRSFFNRFETKEPVKSRLCTMERGCFETTVRASREPSQPALTPSSQAEGERQEADEGERPPEGMLTVQPPDAPSPDQLRKVEFTYQHPSTKGNGQKTHRQVIELRRMPVPMPQAPLCGDCIQASFLKPGVLSFQETVSIVSNAGLHPATKQRLLQTFRVFRPGVKDFQAVPDPRGYSYLYLIEEKGNPQPAQALGEGFCWTLTMIAQILKSKATVIFVDEMDTGLHHTVMKEFWLSLLGFLRINPTTQLFATTHSEELVTATIEAFGDCQEFLRIYRFLPDGNGGAIIREGGFETIESLNVGHIYQT